ncbi:hypothetical protein BaRGS_00002131 [Batillaria attramentaria]|uniref:Uncharacterized protein n=1 Tax=Batillaria attramentaria TaxID=370345 RepID=A0ABD0M5L0_9CAEN
MGCRPRRGRVGSWGDLEVAATHGAVHEASSSRFPRFCRMCVVNPDCCIIVGVAQHAAGRVHVRLGSVSRGIFSYHVMGKTGRSNEQHDSDYPPRLTPAAVAMPRLLHQQL